MCSIALAFTVIALAVTASPVRWQEGNWDSKSGRYLYACMRAAGYDLTSRAKVDGTTDLRVPDHCIAWDMKRIELPECYEPYGDSRTKPFGLCEMDAIKNTGYEQGDYDGPGARYLYACMRAVGYELESPKTHIYCTPGDNRTPLFPECYKSKKD